MFLVRLSNSSDNVVDTDRDNRARSAAADCNINESQGQSQTTGLKRFKFLFARMDDTASSTGNNTNRQETVLGQLNLRSCAISPKLWTLSALMHFSSGVTDVSIIAN